MIGSSSGCSSFVVGDGKQLVISEVIVLEICRMPEARAG